ncbi:hypothetical protein DEU56DRAFT_926411 [Suillus clintonianus]|uniref:uncharacterized protein n=1 Tax=Suillus clintonianus TaxID=1904413 RepID=UPI001B85FE1A|nr:uncharacterized protein DEU56DRAFT_926411 [Suillus clintonianus]KAG2148831.1 hypothetical protein DEU56DRAFT_926411 [Suillus clintonianus]
MDPDRSLPPAPAGQFSSQSQGQSSQPTVQEPSPLVGPEHIDREGRPESQSVVTEKPLLGSSDPHSPSNSPAHSPAHSPARDRSDPYADFEPVQPPPPARNRDGNMLRGPSRRSVGGYARSNASGIGWIVPGIEEKPHRRTIGERLAPTIDNAEKERARYATKGLALNIAIGLQVLLGALTTGISAATSGKQTSIGISILGGAATLVASYLARTRGSNEPELSITRVKDLDQFLRDCLAFKMDHGHEYGSPGDDLNARLDHLRRRFEELLGNGDGQRKLSPPV